jgi:hypothetical protein
MTIDPPVRGTAALPAAVAAAGGHHSHEVAFLPVHDRLAPILDQAVLLGDIPVLGSPAWADIPLDDTRWRYSVVVAGYRWAFDRWLLQDSEVEAAQAISASEDWPARARSMRQRAEFCAANP